MDPFLQSADGDIQDAAGGLDTAALSRSVAGRWSIAEILEHLTLAFTACSAGLEKILAAGEPRARPPKLVQRLGRILVTDIGYFPRANAPEMTRPRGTIPPAESVRALRTALAALDDTLARAAAKFGDDVPLTNHPYFAGMSVRHWRKFHWRHTVHHMRQIRQLSAIRSQPSASTEKLTADS